jgi:hypothetical protein
LEYQYWYHKQSGLIYAVMYRDGRVFIVAGPVSYEQATARNLDPDIWPFGYRGGMEDWLNAKPDDFALYELREEQA